MYKSRFDRKDLQKEVLRRYFKHKRKTTIVSTDPILEHKLTEEGELLREERKMQRRIKAMRQRQNMSKAQRASKIAVDSDTPSETSESCVSFDGVPDPDLPYMLDQTLAKQIQNRRTDRRLAGVYQALEEEAINSNRREMGSLHQIKPGKVDKIDQQL